MRAVHRRVLQDRIIGHYEVPLTHRGRDRERGRIWRIVYRRPRGDKQLMPTELPADEADLNAELGSTNPTRRRLALDNLADTHRPAGVACFTQRVQRRTDEYDAKIQFAVRPASAGRLEEQPVAMGDAQPLVRIHATKLAAEQRLATPALLLALQRALGDADPFIERATAQGLAGVLPPPNVSLLLTLLARAPNDDDHLRHAVRIALRDQLADDRVSWRLSTFSEARPGESRTADRPPLNAVPTAAAAEQQLTILERSEQSKSQLGRTTAEHRPGSGCLRRGEPPAHRSGPPSLCRRH